MLSYATQDGSALVAAATALSPAIEAASAEIDQGRCLPVALVQAMKDAGIFRMAMPRAWGGPEADPLTQIRVVEALSRADGSVGWCAMIGSDGGYLSAFLDPAVGRELYQDLDAVTGTTVAPSGEAVIVPGGYRVSGRWTFGSGCQHASWVAANCVVHDESGPRHDATGVTETRYCFLSAAQFTVIDTWTTSGLRGSGSHDYTASDVFVPGERTFNLATSPIRHVGPLYGFRTMFLVNAVGVPLGIAQGAIDAVLALASRKRTRQGKGLAEESHVQVAVARADALVGAARGYVNEVIGDIWTSLCAGDSLTSTQRARFYLCMMAACHWCVDTVDLMQQVAGSSSVYLPNALDRHFRDIHTVTQHAMFSTKLYEPAGRMLLGLEPNQPGF